MSVFRYRHLVICLVLVSVLLGCTVTASAAVTADSLANSLSTGWMSSYAPSGFTNSWFWRMIDFQLDLTTGWSSSYASGYGSSWYYRVIQEIEALATNQNSILTGINNTHSLLNGVYGIEPIYRLLANIDGNVFDALADANSIATYTSAIMYDTAYLEIYLPRIADDIQSFDEYLLSISDDVSIIQSDFADIADVIAPASDLLLKDAVSDEQNAFTDGFGSVDRTGDIGDLSGLSSGMTEWFDLPNVDISSTFEQVESGYSSWFSAETAQALTVGAGASAVAGVALMSEDEHVDPETPYLDAWNQEVQDILSGGDGEW